MISHSELIYDYTAGTIRQLGTFGGRMSSYSEVVESRVGETASRDVLRQLVYHLRVLSLEWQTTDKSSSSFKY